MHSYGQYCPVAKAIEIVGDRWTLLIVRDLLTGVRHFNDLERGLPGISRGLLADRLRRLQRLGVIDKTDQNHGRRRTRYELTKAGEELQGVIQALLLWGARWAFDSPDPADLDPLLLLWWMRDRVRVELLPKHRVVIQFDFSGATNETYWLLLTRKDVSVCLTAPEFEIDVLVTADLATLFEVWLGRADYADALRDRRIVVDALPALARAFPTWFAYSPAAAAVRTVRAGRSQAAQ